MATALLDDELWRLIEPLLPVRKRLDDRRTLSGILFVLRTGIAWQQLPQELGYGSEIHEAFLSLACSLICLRALRGSFC